MDIAVHIGPAEARDSYLNIERILRAARDTGCEAIHPGYGFLSENAGLARACDDQGIVFVGPTPDAIEAMGSKIRAKEIMQDSGIPLVPGYHGADQSLAHLKHVSDEIGYPVLIKASAGGGGKGMRIVRAPDGFEAALEGAKRESAAAFGDEQVLLEKYLDRPRHVEIQVFRDNEKAVLDVMRATGFVFSSAGELITLGQTPPAETIEALVDRVPELTAMVHDDADELEEWQQAKLILAAEYIDAVYDSLRYSLEDDSF